MSKEGNILNITEKDIKKRKSLDSVLPEREVKKLRPEEEIKEKELRAARHVRATNKHYTPDKTLLQSKKTHYNPDKNAIGRSLYGHTILDTIPVIDFLDQKYGQSNKIDINDPNNSADSEKISGKKATLFATTAMANDAAHTLFKGIFSRTNPHGSSHIRNWKKFVEERVALQEHLKSDAIKYPHIFRDFINSLKEGDLTEGGLFTQAAIDRLLGEVKKQIEKEENLSKEEAKKLQDMIEKTSNAFHHVVKEATNEKDEMWKYRLLQAILILTPFSPIQFIAPIVGAFAPFLQGTEGFAAFIASFLSTDGPLGPIIPFITDRLQLDVAAEWILSQPLGFISDTMDVIMDFVSPVTGAIIPGLQSPLFAIVIAGGYSFSRIPTEYDHYTNFANNRKKQREEFTKEMIKFQRNYQSSYDKREGGFVEAMLTKMQEEYINKELSLFLSYQNDIGDKNNLLQILLGDTKMPNSDVSFADFMKKNAKFYSDPEKVDEFLQNKENQNLRKFLCDGYHLVNEILTENGQKDPQELKVLIDESYKDGTFVEKIAQNRKRQEAHCTTLIALQYGLINESDAANYQSKINQTHPDFTDIKKIKETMIKRLPKPTMQPQNMTQNIAQGQSIPVQ